MTELFIDYGLFLAKAITIVVAIIVVISVAAAAAQSRQRRDHKGEILVTPLNEFYDELQEGIKHSILTKDELKDDHKQRKKEEKLKKKNKEKTSRKRIYVLDFDGDVRAGGVENLAHEITAVLTVAEAGDEVVVRLESPGGQVHAYGLAASQLLRIRQRDINLTISVDKVAASGGYMMACTATKIIAAPFAILGSIGVVAELPNFNRVLKKYDVDYDIYTAGEFKRTVTMLGENTPEGKKKFVDEIEETHVLFKQMVSQNRPALDIDHIATGEHWYGTQCLEKGLVDEISTSDDYLFAAIKERDLFEVKYEIKKSMADRLGLAAEGVLNNTLGRVMNLLTSRGKELI